jgi:hypothetical protein
VENTEYRIQEGQGKSKKGKGKRKEARPRRPGKQDNGEWVIKDKRKSPSKEDLNIE